MPDRAPRVIGMSGADSARRQRAGAAPASAGAGAAFRRTAKHRGPHRAEKGEDRLGPSGRHRHRRPQAATDLRRGDASSSGGARLRRPPRPSQRRALLQRPSRPFPAAPTPPGLRPPNRSQFRSRTPKPSRCKSQRRRRPAALSPRNSRRLTRSRRRGKYRCA